MTFSSKNQLLTMELERSALVKNEKNSIEFTTIMNCLWQIFIALVVDPTTNFQEVGNEAGNVTFEQSIIAQNDIGFVINVGFKILCNHYVEFQSYNTSESLFRNEWIMLDEMSRRNTSKFAIFYIGTMQQIKKEPKELIFPFFISCCFIFFS